MKGRVCPLCPSNSDVNLFGDFKRIIDLYSKVPDGALDFGVPKKQLNSAQVAGALVDHCCLGPSQRVRSKEARVKTGTGNPFGDQTSILTSRQTTIRSPATSKQEAAWLLPRRTHVIIKSLSCLFGDFKPDGCPVFFCRTVARSIA